MITTKELHFGYKNRPELFSGLNLEIKAGSIYGLLGKNGAGKTTLLRLMTGLLFPQSGSCQIFDGASSKRLATTLQELYFLPQEFYLPDLTLAEYANCHSIFYKKFDHQSFKNMLTEFELVITQPLLSLSDGQKKKFLLAFALASNCRLLLLDEPTNGLDIPGKTILRRLLAASLDEDKTVIISTHQVREVENLIDRVAILNNGKIILEQSLLAIEKTLHFGITTDRVPAKTIYQEPTLGGRAYITPNDGASDSLVNLELLFNAALAQPLKFADIQE